jgi:molybdate transport system substrate-binding protein
MNPPALRLLSAGAAQGLANELAPRLRAIAGAELQGTFMPAGAVREKLLAGDACDVVVTTPAMLDDFARDGRVDRSTIASIGRVHTAIAVRGGDPAPAIDTPERLGAALSSARRIFLPDPQRATAAIHFVKVLRALGLYESLGARFSVHPNGAAAMAALASTADSGCLGCTQSTEILATQGVTLVGALPAPLDLATVYAGAVCTSARDADVARRFLALLCGPEGSELRQAAGFE